IPSPTLLGGKVAAFCGGQNAVRVGDNCFGAALHPRLVVYAAHCGTDVQFVQTENETASVVRCETVPDYNVFGRDVAYCLLESPLATARIATVNTDCEGVMLKGDNIYIRTTQARSADEIVALTRVVETGEDFTVAAPAVGACKGSSGSPAYA